MGHMGNGAHGQWGPWAMGPMVNGAHGPMSNLDFFAYNIINTGWILTKILLDIDINVFYVNTNKNVKLLKRCQVVIKMSNAK